MLSVLALNGRNIEESTIRKSPFYSGTTRSGSHLIHNEPVPLPEQEILMNVLPPRAKKIKPKIYKRSEHTISRSKIDPDALKIMYRLIRHGYKAYLVGGGVRDLALKKTPKDFDISTDATPRKIKSLFRNSRIIGRRFKLVHVYFKNNKIIEVSTFRDASDPEDVKGDLDQKDLLIVRDNTFGTEVTDAIRRDITINALFYDLATFSVIDYVGGIEDLRKNLIRVIGDPDIRFAEDPVRMLRVGRHAARASFRIDIESWKSILRNHELILQCPNVRIYQEMLKDMSSGSFLEILQLLSGAELLQHFIPEVVEESFPRLTAENDFTRAVRRADELIADGKITSPTIFLTLIALFRRGRDVPQEVLLSRFEYIEELVTFISSGFSRLAVPRRERERILDTLSLWYKIRSQDPDRIKVGTLSRRVCIEDLELLYEVLDIDNELSDIVRKAARARRGAGKRTRKGRRSRRSSGKRDTRSKSQSKTQKSRRRRGRGRKR